jgi:hypothetical protein
VSSGDEVNDYERRFRRAGLPLFVEGFSAPLLGLVFIAELLGAGRLDWTWWQNLLAIAGGLALMLVAVGAINLARDRPLRAIPNRLGKTELAAFVILPRGVPHRAHRRDEHELQRSGRLPAPAEG